MTREMTDAQFKAALERNGFKAWTLWAEHRDLPNHHFSMIFHRDGKIAKRATIAHLIKRVNTELAKRRKPTS